MNSTNVMEALRISLDRTVPVYDPEYLIGEDESKQKFQQWIDSVNATANGFIGSVILGQVGNGKTHLLRYFRKHYNEESNNTICIYVPDMFAGGPFITALNAIYESIFLSRGNKSLSSFSGKWETFLTNNSREAISSSDNVIIKYLLNCNNKDETQLTLSYFSNDIIFPDQLKFLRTKFGAPKNFINNDIDFAERVCDGLEFIQKITGKSIILLFDEVDKVYSVETRSECLSSVSAKILGAYRLLFDRLNIRNIKGLISIGATPEAWQVLTRQTAFERRFNDRKIVLKVPKDKNDCLKFIERRLEEVNYIPIEGDKEIINKLVNSLNAERITTWANVISELSGKQESRLIVDNLEPSEIILNILNAALKPMTWAEIKSKSEVLRDMYPKSPPISILTKLINAKMILANLTTPKTYESLSISEENRHE